MFSDEGDISWKGREFIQIFVVKGLQKCLGFGLEDLEVYAQARLVQFPGSYGNLYLPVVAMEVFAIPLIMLKAMGCSKRCADH